VDGCHAMADCDGLLRQQTVMSSSALVAVAGCGTRLSWKAVVAGCGGRLFLADYSGCYNADF